MAKLKKKENKFFVLVITLCVVIVFKQLYNSK